MKDETYYIDLTVKKPGCTENPVIRLAQLLSRVQESGGVLNVVSDEREVPYKVLEMLAKKRNLKIEITERNGTKIKVAYSR